LADRYWVGGSGNWSDTNRWSATSGGAGGSSVPGTGDSVFFDANSDAGSAFTVTVDGTSASPSLCNDFTASGLDQAMTLSMSGTAFLDCYGSMSLPATNLTWSGTFPCGLRFRATTTGKTVTTNGVTLSNTTVTFNGVGGGWTLGSALTATGSANTDLAILAGTFDTGNYNISVDRTVLSSTGTSTRVINLGSSTLTAAALLTRNPVILSGSGLTFNAGTSQINITGDNHSGTFIGGGNTFYNVSYTALGTSVSQPFAPTIDGANTFNNLSFATPSASAFNRVTFVANQTITGTLSVQSGNTDPTRRILFNSNTPGTQRTITAAAIDFGSGIDFQDIVAAGAASPFNVSALQGGDCKGNSNITFPAAKTVYRIGTGNFSDTQWASTSGGTPAADQFPLAQDTMVFDANTTTGTHTVNAAYQLGTIDTTGLTANITIPWTATAGGPNPAFYGDITLTSFVTFFGSNLGHNVGLLGRTIQTVTSPSTAVTTSFFVGFGTTWKLGSNLFGFTGNYVSVNRGTLDLNNFTLTCQVFSCTGTETRNIAFGTGKIVLTSAPAFNMFDSANLTNFTYTGSGIVEFTNSSSNARNFSSGSSGGTESNTFNIRVLAGSGTFTISNNSRVKSLDYTGFSGTIAGENNSLTLYGNLTIPSAATVNAGTGVKTFGATSGTQQITTNGKTLDFPITVNASGATVQLQDNLTMGATRTLTHTAGTVDLNGKTLTVGTDYSTSNSNTRAIAFNNGTLVCPGNFTATTGTNLTTSGTGTISMTSASAKTFAGGGRTYPTLNQGGAGTLTITGANTFADITNSNATASQITFPASTVTKVKAFTLVGTSGNLVSLRSSTPGTRFNLTYEP
jgi:hypothetical protein